MSDHERAVAGRQRLILRNVGSPDNYPGCMAIEVIPTLEVMAGVYRKPTAGGSASDRFRAYVAAGRAGLPVSGYNPMTAQPVLDTIDALMGVGAEDCLEEVANRTAEALGYEQDDVMYVTVAAPGMWTDRLATEVEHRFVAKQPEGVLLWVDAQIEASVLSAEFVAQTLRLIHHRRYGPPSTLADAFRQEGLAGALGGAVGRAHPEAAEVLRVLADNSTLAIQVAFFYGDEAASTMGFTPLGLTGRIGYEHAVSQCASVDPLIG
jgi:hypothetical protein